MGVEEEPGAENSDRKRRPAAIVGVILMGLSLVLWLPIPAVPFLPMGAAGKAALAGTLVVSAEIAFWLGAALAGPEAARRMRFWWRTRRKKRSD